MTPQRVAMWKSAIRGYCAAGSWGGSNGRKVHREVGSAIAEQ